MRPWHPWFFICMALFFGVMTVIAFEDFFTETGCRGDSSCWVPSFLLSAVAGLTSLGILVVSIYMFCRDLRIKSGMVIDRRSRPNLMGQVIAAFAVFSPCPLVLIGPDSRRPFQYELKLRDGAREGWVKVTEDEYKKYLVGMRYPSK